MKNILVVFWLHLIQYISRSKENVVKNVTKELSPIGKGDQELEKRLDQKELT